LRGLPGHRPLRREELSVQRLDVDDDRLDLLPIAQVFGHVLDAVARLVPGVPVWSKVFRRQGTGPFEEITDGLKIG
jgi:hypothetical protein